ncbi:hypothetical protein NG791_25075 [Laspinema sp. D1]|uniref:hypothetical protein n=1 Tax=Laspinema palackyanum TaxID=3231601 RepID=UPI003487FDC9|nr:hypothetical protein [Laspinema sp. D2b]
MRWLIWDSLIQTKVRSATVHFLIQTKDAIATWDFLIQPNDALGHRGIPFVLQVPSLRL